jgi:hypothetical protein
VIGPRKTTIPPVFLFSWALVIPVIFFLSGPALSQAPAAAPTSSTPTVESSSPSGSPPTLPTGDPTPSDSPPTLPAGDPKPLPEAEKAPADSEEDIEEREVTRIPLVGVAQGGILLQRDQLVLEPTVAYSFSSNTRLIVSGFSVLPLIVLGDLESEKVKTQTFTPQLGMRYGLYRGLQLDFRVPFLLQTVTRLRVSTETAGQVEESSEDFGIGDVTFGITYQFLYEQDWYPDMTLRIGATAPTGRSQFDIFDNIAAEGPLNNVEEFLTRLNDEGAALGTGRWFIDASISGVKALDPAILFGTLGYSYSPPVTETLIRIAANAVTGGVELIPEPIESNLGPVNQISQSLGMAISLNNRISMNFSFSNLYRFSTKVDGQEIPDSSINVANLNLGFNLALTPQVTTNVTGTVGLTDDAPDFAFTLTTPVSITRPLARSIEWVKELFSDPISPSPQTQGNGDS